MKGYGQYLASPSLKTIPPLLFMQMLFMQVTSALNFVVVNNNNNRGGNKVKRITKIGTTVQRLLFGFNYLKIARFVWDFQFLSEIEDIILTTTCLSR
jgi:hypothetical protein